MASTEFKNFCFSYKADFEHIIKTLKEKHKINISALFRGYCQELYNKLELIK